ncbi:MAG: hypothetical protein ACRDVE_10165 [Actinocrinis sp.]
MSLVQVPPVDPAQVALVELHADAIEHAMHEGRLADVGLRTDDEVAAQIEVSITQARTRLGDRVSAMAALAAADYCEDPTAFVERRRAALWRSCQMHGCEQLFWAMNGQDPSIRPAPVFDALGDLLLDETAGPGSDGDW